MKNYEKYAEEIKKYRGNFCKDFTESYILKTINTECYTISCVQSKTYWTLWLLKVVELLEEASIDYCREYGYAEDENILYLPYVIEIIKRGGVR